MKQHALPSRYVLPAIPVRRLLMALGAVVTLIAWTRP